VGAAGDLEPLAAEGGDSLQETEPAAGAAAGPEAKRQHLEGDDRRSLWPWLWSMELMGGRFSGSGSFGEVFLYTVRCDGQAQLAVKTSLGSDAAEFEAAQYLVGHWFIRYHNIHIVDDPASGGRRSFILMEAAIGSLLRWISYAEEHEVYKDHAIGVLFPEVLEGLSEMHRRRFIHADVSPGNVLIDCEDTSNYRTCHAKLGDFGLTCQPGKHVAMPCSYELYKCPYRAPELLAAEVRLGPRGAEIDEWRMENVGPKTDSFAAGVLLYETYFGHRPVVLDGTDVNACPRPDAALFDVEEDEGFRELARRGHRVVHVLRGLLAREPGLRWTAEDAVRCLRASAADWSWVCSGIPGRRGPADAAGEPAPAAELPACWRDIELTGEVTQWFPLRQGEALQCCCPAPSGATAQQYCRVLQSNWPCQQQGLFRCQGGLAGGVPCRCKLRRADILPTGLPIPSKTWWPRH